MNPKAQKIAFDITKLRIQGASRIQAAAIQALYWTAQQTKAKTPKSFQKELEQTGLVLMKARPTEPDLRTAIRIIWKAVFTKKQGFLEAKKAVLQACEDFSKNRKSALEKIAIIGAQQIPQNAVILTHCHSHTVAAILKKAKKKIKHVYCTETRPLFQGRITATNLAKAGIPVTQIVDSAAARILKTQNVNVFVTGCDAILANGTVINKIGTREISLAAKQNNVPHLIFSSSHSFDPLTFFGWQEPIEERSWKEVWPKKPKKVRILNPAFDETPANHVQKIVCEYGSFAPKAFVTRMKKEFKVQHDKKEYLNILRKLKK
ncbi:S-methyl-5-thioribose-1-phosphate isomerase [Candidatus Micrarchaeota archaeon]|nr:S-methyl-5-thioribose-1-phosphate isomerase [Candidatus Micrarchaeota archaeon]